MKIFVVDDEPLITRYIVQCIQNVSNEYQVIGTASSGVKALEKIKENRPDVVFTDITMPKMEGLELLRELKKTYPHIGVVMLTCHEDFEYARQAIRGNADDYILKSEVNPEFIKKKLEKLSATLKATNRIQTSNLLRADRETGSVRIISKQSLGEPHLLLQEDAFSAVSFFNTPKNTETVLQNLPDAFENFLMYQYSESTNVLVFNIHHGNECSSFEEKEQAINVYVTCRMKNLTGPVARSRIFYRLANLPRAIEEAVEALEFSFYGKTMQRKMSHGEMEQQMQHMMLNASAHIDEKNVFAWCSVVEKMLNFAEDNQPHIHVLLDLLEHMLELLRRLDTVDQLQPEQLASDSFATLRAQMLSYLENVRGIAKKHSKPIEKALAYIGGHYQENLTLNLVAEHVFLNREYLCRHFKKEVGVNFSEYLMTLRLRESMKLLKTTALRTGEVAERVGVPNVSYFTAAFKKQYGMTPSEARKK